MIRITVDYGYDNHEIEIDEKTYMAIKSGKEVKVKGQGFMHEEDGFVDDYWTFNDSPDAISFSLDNGAQFISQEHWVDVVE